MDVFDQSELKRSCEECSSSKVKCSQDKPTCKRCQKQEITCTYAPAKRTGRPRKIRKDTKHPQPRAIRPLASAASRTDNHHQPPIEKNSPFSEYNVSQGTYAYYQHDLGADSWFGFAGDAAVSTDVAHLGKECHFLGHNWSPNAQDLEALWRTTLDQQSYTDGGLDSSEAKLGSYEEDFAFMHAMWKPQHERTCISESQTMPINLSF